MNLEKLTRDELDKILVLLNTPEFGLILDLFRARQIGFKEQGFAMFDGDDTATVLRMGSKLLGRSNEIDEILGLRDKIKAEIENRK